MSPADIIFIVYGACILTIDAWGIYQPKQWVEYVERQFIYRRERFSAGAFFVLLGLIPVIWIIELSGLAFYVLAATSAVFIIMSALIFGLPDSLRNMILSIGALDDKWARVVFGADAAFGLLFILIGAL